MPIPAAPSYLNTTYAAKPGQLTRALELFEQVGAAPDAQQVRQVLDAVRQEHP